MFSKKSGPFCFIPPPPPPPHTHTPPPPPQRTTLPSSAGQYVYNDQSCEICPGGRYAPSAQEDECLECFAGFFTGSPNSSTTCTSCGEFLSDLNSPPFGLKSDFPIYNTHFVLRWRQMVREELDDMFNLRSGKVQWELLAFLHRLRRGHVLESRKQRLHSLCCRHVHSDDRRHRLRGKVDHNNLLRFPIL